jgi:protein arginine kinase activator
MRCELCEKETYCPYHISELNSKGKWEDCDLCMTCAIEFMSALEPSPLEPVSEPEPEGTLDLTEIKTTEDLLSFINAHQQDNKEPCPRCGLTLKEFDIEGRFGCPECYDHFDERMEELVYPYHSARKHVGKVPKRPQNIEDQKKLLKLKMASAIELEQYEKAKEIKKELDDLNDSP